MWAGHRGGCTWGGLKGGWGCPVPGGLQKVKPTLLYLMDPDNLVEGKRKRRSVAPPSPSSGSTTPVRKSPEPLSSKRKLAAVSEEEQSPAKRGRRLALSKAGEARSGDPGLRGCSLLSLGGCNSAVPSWLLPMLKRQPGMSWLCPSVLTSS